MTAAAQLSLSPQFDTFERICAYWAANHPKYLAHLRELAIAIARRRGTVTIDDVREEMARFKVPFPKEIGADERIFGSLLRGCPKLRPVNSRTTQRIKDGKPWAQRVGVNRDQVTVYALDEAA